MSLPYPPPYQDLATLAEHLCTSEHAIEGWVKRGEFPAPKRQGGKRLWSWREVERHLEGRGQVMARSLDQIAEGIRNATREATAHHPGQLRNGDQSLQGK
jgi:hypothetical protein